VAEIVVTIDVAAPAGAVWTKLIDWPTHGEWMLLTRVETASPEVAGIGAGIVGVTGIGPITMRDTMVVTAWSPPPANPARCGVDHTGRVVRGSAAFDVEAIDEMRSRITWSEWVRLPFGIAGQLGWFVVRPIVVFALKISLRRLAKSVEAGAR